MRRLSKSGDTRNSLQMTSWFTSKSCARAETSIASAQIPVTQYSTQEIQ